MKNNQSYDSDFDVFDIKQPQSKEKESQSPVQLQFQNSNTEKQLITDDFFSTPKPEKQNNILHTHDNVIDSDFNIFNTEDISKNAAIQTNQTTVTNFQNIDLFSVSSLKKETNSSESKSTELSLLENSTQIINEEEVTQIQVDNQNVFNILSLNPQETGKFNQTLKSPNHDSDFDIFTHQTDAPKTPQPIYRNTAAHLSHN